MEGGTNCVPGEPSRSFVLSLWWRSLKNGNTSSACPWKEVRVDRDVQRRCSWTPHSRIAVLSSKETPVLSSHPSPTSSGHLNILHTCHRTESSSYWKPSRMSESRTPEFLSRLKLHTLLTWESPPHTVSMFPQLSVALITRYILESHFCPSFAASLV